YAFTNLGAGSIAVTRFDPPPYFFDKPGVFGLAGGNIGAGHVPAGGFGEVDIAPLGDQQGVIAGFGHLMLISPEFTHLLSRLDVVTIAAELKPIGIGHGATRLHAQQRSMSFVIAGIGVVGVVGGHRLESEVL